MSAWYFHYQKTGGEDAWLLAQASERERIQAQVKPAFVNVLDLSAVPEDNDWSKVRYRGPYYVDFDADDDLELACFQFQSYLVKLESELGFDIFQAKLYASGGKGFHIEIPQECFIAQVPRTGTPWLPYIYREMSQSLMVDTLDLKVYSGKRGRMWRTPGVQRENGNYKVPIRPEEAMIIDADMYREIIKSPREEVLPTPASCNTQFSLLYERAREKTITHMRGKKKRIEKANKLLDPWRRAKKTPPTLERIMAGENLNPEAGFQSISMQLAIYATSVGMELPEFLDRTRGVCENHVSDSRRYNTPDKRRVELQRMYDYMAENTLYEFDVGPISGLLPKGTPMPDLGNVSREEEDEAPATAETVVDPETGEEMAGAPVIDHHKSVRRGFVMNSTGMFLNRGENSESVCRASLTNVVAFYGVEPKEFKGYGFDIVVAGKTLNHALLGADAFTSGNKLKNFFAHQQLSFQGSDIEATSLADVMSERARQAGHVTYVYPREGFFVISNPEIIDPTPVKVFLTKTAFFSSVPAGEPGSFKLEYRAENAISAYNIDIDKAPELSEKHIPGIHDLFNINRPEVVADLVGWFVAAHWRSLYLYCHGQFPVLQVWGEAGAGKTKTVELLAHLHWYAKDNISIKSAIGCTPFALHSHASSSTSAPLIMDEYKPKEMRAVKGRLENFWDLVKANYTCNDIGERGTLNKGAENHLAVVKSKATAPLVFMCEAVETQTAIVERCVTVGVTKQGHTKSRTLAFNRLYRDPECLSALGRALIEEGFAIPMDAMRAEMDECLALVEASLPALDDETRKRISPRSAYNRALVIHALRRLRKLLARQFGKEFDEDFDRVLGARADYTLDDEAITAQGMSEISKVISRIAMLSRETDRPYECRIGKEYYIDDGYVDINAEACYDRYRLYCSAINESPLFSNTESFLHALNSYSATIDRICAGSMLRDDNPSAHLFRLSQPSMLRERVHLFRDLS